MKKLLVASACTLCFTLAHAQSSVTLYGTLDVGVDAVSNESGHRTALMSTGVLIPNLFGLKGSEDLGGVLERSSNLKVNTKLVLGQPMAPRYLDVRRGLASQMIVSEHLRWAISMTICFRR